MKTVLLILFSLFPFALLDAEEANLTEKTARYHQLLLERPQSNTLFERFLNAWLDTHSKEELETFLLTEAQTNNDSPKHALLLTTFYQYLGQETKALAALNKAVLQHPQAKPLQLARAKLKAQLLDFDGALADLTKAEPLTNPEDLLLRGTWLARSGQPEQAVAVWKELLAADLEDENLAEDLIELEVSEGLYQEALATLGQLINRTRDPYQKALRTLRLASIQELAGQSQEALTTYQKLLPESGQDSWLEKEILAQVEASFRRQDNLTGLRDFYQTLRQDLPQRISLKKGLASQMANNGEEKEAIALFREILKITPGDRANRLQFISLLEDLEEFDLALSEVAFLLREQPEDQTLLEHQARLYDHLGNREGLKATLAALARLRGKDANTLLATASLYQRYKFPIEAEELLRATTLQFPDQIEPREALATFLANPLNEKSKQAEATQIWLGIAKDADAEGLLRVARSLQSNNRPQECFQLLQERLPEFPDNALLLTQLCNVALQASREEEALPYALHLTDLAKVPTEFESALKLVAQLARQLDLTDLIAERIAQDDKSSIQWCVLAELYQIQNDFEASAEALAQARQIDDSVLVASQQIRLLQTQGNWPQATARLRELIASPGGNRPANLNKLIQLLIDSGDIPAALVEVEKWKKRSPGDKHAWTKRAELLTQSGRLHEAALELRRAHTKFNQDLDIRNRLAKALLAAGDYPAAERLYLKIYQEAKDATARNRAITELTTLAQQENRTEELLADFQRRKRQNPRETGPLLALARIYEVLQQYDQQHDALAEALRRRPNDSELRLQLSKLEENAGRIDQATHTLRDGLALNAGPKIRQALAAFYFRNGELERGLELSLELNRDDPRALEATVLTLCQSQEWELALRHLKLGSSSDIRLQCLRALILIQLDQSQEANLLLAQLLSNTTATFPPGLTVTNSPTFKQAAFWAQRNNPRPEPQQVLVTFFGGQIQTLQQTSAQAYSAYGSGRQSSDVLPGDATELHAFTLALIYTKSQSLSDLEVRAQFLAQFPLPNDPYLQLLFNPDFNNWIRTEFDNQRLTLPQVVPYLRHASFPRESLIAALDDPDFVAEQPAVAIQVALELASKPIKDEENSRDWFARALAIVPQLDEIERDRYLLQLSSYFNSDVYNPYSRTGRRTPNHWELFSELVLSEISAHQSDQSAISQKPWFQNFRQGLYTHNRAADYLKLLNLSCREFIEHPPGKNPSANNPYSVYGYQQQPRSAISYSPTFPPQSAPLPPFVFANFAKTRSDELQKPEVTEAQQQLLNEWRAQVGSKVKPSSTQSVHGLDPVTFRPFIPQIENKLVRALAYHWAGAKEELDKLMAEFAASNDPQSLLFALTYYFDPQDPTKSLSILKKLPREGLNKSQGAEVDRYWLQIGAALRSRNKLSPEDLALVKKAIPRYRRTSEAVQNQRHLDGLLTQIDPDLKPTPRQTTRSSQYRPGAGRYRARQKIEEKVESLLSQDQIKQAANLTLKSLNSTFRRSRSLQGGSTSKVLALLKENPSFKTVLLASVESANQESFQGRLFTAELYFTLNDESKALALLRQLSQTRPGDQQLTSRITLLERNIARSELLANPSQEISLADLTSIMNSGGHHYQAADNKSSPTRPLPIYLAVTTRTLNAAAPQNLYDYALNWPLELLRTCVSSGTFSDLAKPSPSLATSGRDFDPERIRLVRENIAACLRYPQLADRAFQIASGCQEALGYTPEQLSIFALEALSVSSRLTNSEEEKNKETVSFPRSVTHQWDRNDSIPEIGLSPQDSLTSWIIKNRLSEDSPEFKALITAVPELTEQTRWATQMVDADLATAQAALDAWLEVLDETPHTKLRHLAARLQVLTSMPEPPPLLETFHQEYLALALSHWGQNNFQSHNLLTPPFKNYLASLWDPEKPQILHAVLAQILAQSLGDENLWSDFVALAKDGKIPAPLQTLSHSYRLITSTLLEQNQEFQIFPTLLSLPPLASSLRSSSFQDILRKRYFYKTGEEAWQVFQAIDLNNISWQTLAFASTGDSNTFFYYFCNHFTRSSEAKIHLLKNLATQDSATLKTLLFSYYITRDQESKESLLVFLEENADGIISLPEDQREAIDLLLQLPFPAGEIPDTTLPISNAIRLLQTLNQKRREQLDTRLQELLTDGFTEDELLKTNHLTRREVIKLVNLSLFEKPALASQLTINYLTALWDTLKGSNSDRAGRELADSHRAILREVLSENRPITDYIAYLASIEASPLSIELPLVSYYSPSKKPFNKLINSLPEPEKNTFFLRWSWDDLADKLQSLSPRDRKILRYHFLIHERIKTSQTLSDYLQWSEDTGFRESHPRLCEDLLLNAAFYRWKECSAEQQELLLGIWQDRLSDPSVSVRLRMSLAVHALERTRDFKQEPAILIATIPIARQWLSQRNATLDKTILVLLKAYLNIASPEQTDELKTLLRECLQKVNSDPLLSRTTNASLQSELLQGLAPLFLRLQDRESFQSLSQSLGQTLSGRPDILLLLAKMDDRESINLLLAREDLPYTQFEAQWNADIAQEVTHLLSLIDDPQKRYRLECHLASVTDDTKAEDQTFEKRPQRLIRLAKQFEELAPLVPTARFECLATLSSPFDLARASLLESPLAEIYQRWPYRRAFGKSSEQPSASLQTILRTYLRLRLAQDDYAPAITASHSLLSVIKEDKRSSRKENEALYEVIQLINSKLLKSGKEFPEKAIGPDLNTLAQELLQHLSQKERISAALSASILNFAILTRQYEQTSSELLGELKKAAEGENPNYSYAVRTLTTTNVTFGFILSDKSLQRPQIQRLTQAPLISRYLFPDYRSFISLIRSLKFENEEISEWGHQLPSDYPRRGELLLAAAEYIARLEREPIFSMPLFEAALVQADKDKDETLTALIQIHKASELRRSEPEEAATIIKSLTLSELPEDERRRFERLFEWAKTFGNNVIKPAEPANDESR